MDLTKKNKVFPEWMTANIMIDMIAREMLKPNAFAEETTGAVTIQLLAPFVAQASVPEEDRGLFGVLYETYMNWMVKHGCFNGLKQYLYEVSSPQTFEIIKQHIQRNIDQIGLDADMTYDNIFRGVMGIRPYSRKLPNDLVEMIGDSVAHMEGNFR